MLPGLSSSTRTRRTRTVKESGERGGNVGSHDPSRRLGGRRVSTLVRMGRPVMVVLEAFGGEVGAEPGSARLHTRRGERNVICAVAVSPEQIRHGHEGPSPARRGGRHLPVQTLDRVMDPCRIAGAHVEHPSAAEPVGGVREDSRGYPTKYAWPNRMFSDIESSRPLYESRSPAMSSERFF